jgi:hypothetical protein
MQANADAKRQPASDIEITVCNPGNKLIMHLGQPTSTKRFSMFDSEVRCARCTFRLPADWYVVNEPGRYETIIARQQNTDRCVSVSNDDPDSIPHAEVLG